MTTAEVQTILEETKCYACLGFSIAELLKLGLVRQWLLTLDPTADTSLANLSEQGKCLACYSMSQFDLLYITLLSMVNDAAAA